jgi:hypothetical protein
MHARRLLLAGTVSLGLLVILAAPAIGQTESATWVTGTMDCGLAGEGTSQEDDSVRLDQFPGQCSATMSDPRVGGTSESDIQEACFKLPGEPCMMFGTTEIAGPDGTWVGTFGSMHDASLTALPAWATLVGTGAYEGWTYVSFTPDQLDPDAVVTGILYEGPPPPWGETLPLSSAEE